MTSAETARRIAAALRVSMWRGPENEQARIDAQWIRRRADELTMKANGREINRVAVLDRATEESIGRVLAEPAALPEANPVDLSTPPLKRHCGRPEVVAWASLTLAHAVDPPPVFRCPMDAARQALFEAGIDFPLPASRRCPVEDAHGTD